MFAPVCVARSVAATAPATVEPGKAKSKIKTVKAKTVKAKTDKVKVGKTKTAKKLAAAKSGKKQIMGKSKHHAKIKRRAPADVTGSIAPKSVPTPGLY